VRNIASMCWLGFGLLTLACDEGGVSSPCPGDQVPCGSACVARGACITSPNGGQANGSGTASTTRTPVDPGPYSSPDCTDSSTSTGTLRAQFSGANLSATSDDSATKQYRLSTNWWNKFDGQTIAYDGLSFTVNNPNDVGTEDDNPIGFPTMYVGTYDGTATANSNLPKLVSSLTTVPTVFSTNAADGARDHYNATYDVWLTPTEATLKSGEYAPPLDGAYLMVWLFDPTKRQPRGQKRASSHTVEGVENTWDVWIDPRSDKSAPCISYVAKTPVNGLAFDLNDFIKDAVKNDTGITNDMYLSVVFAGFEIWSGGTDLQVKNFCVNVN